MPFIRIKIQQEVPGGGAIFLVFNSIYIIQDKFYISKNISIIY